jgi:hypothetical protein
MTASVPRKSQALTGTRPTYMPAAFTDVTRFIQRVPTLVPLRNRDAPVVASRTSTEIGP